MGIFEKTSNGLDGGFVVTNHSYMNDNGYGAVSDKV